MHDLTLHWAAAVLGLSQVFLTQQVDRLMLVDLHTGTYVVVSMQEEREGTGQMLALKKEKQKQKRISDHIVFIDSLSHCGYKVLVTSDKF